MSRYIKKTTVLIKGQSILIILGVVINIIYARVLGPEKMGLTYLYIFLPNFVDKFGRLGLAQSAIYYLSNKALHLKSVMSNLILLGLIFSSMFICIMHYLMPYYCSKYMDNAVIQRSLVNAITICIVADFQNNYLTAVLIAQEKVKQLNIIKIFSMVINITSGIYFLFVSNLDYYSPVYAFTVGKISMLAALMVFLRSDLMSIKWINCIDIKTIKKLLSYGFFIMGNTILAFCKNQSIFLFTGFFLSNANVGIYKISTGIVEKFNIITRTCSTMLLPRLSKQSRKNAVRSGLIVLRLVASIMFLISTVIFLTSSSIVNIVYGDDYYIMSSILPIICPTIYLMAYARLISIIFNCIGSPKVPFLINIFSFTMTVIFSFFFIRKFSIEGAAYSFLFSWFIQTFITIIVLNKICKIKINEIILPKRQDWLFLWSILFAPVKNN